MFALTLAVRGQAAAQGYGAIATSYTGDWGLATNYASLGQAQREALRSCGDVNCAIRAAFRGCGAVARRGYSLAWGVSRSQDRAESKALAALDGEGEILGAVCNR